MWHLFFDFHTILLSYSIAFYVKIGDESSLVSSIKIRPKGIEPLSQEPESYVISTTLRAHNKD